MSKLLNQDKHFNSLLHLHSSMPSPHPENQLREPGGILQSLTRT